MSFEMAAWDCGNTTKDEFLGLRRKANEGDEPALTKLRSLLQRHPSLASRLGNLAALTEETICANFVTPNDCTLPIVVAEKAQQLRQELLAGSSSPILRLCVDRVVLGWLELYRLETFYSDESKESPAVANVLIRQKATVERRYQSALRLLAVVRGLLERPIPTPKQRAAGQRSTSAMEIMSKPADMQ